MTGTPMLVIHDAGDPDGGRAWARAMADAGWQGEIHAPDLPGHGATPAPVGGNYEFADAVFALLPLLRDLEGGESPVVVGVGASGWSAQLIALAGRAASLVLVDGLGGPWLTAPDAITAGRMRMRALAADPDAMAPPPRAGFDPRLRHSMGRLGSRNLAVQAMSKLPVPLLALEAIASKRPPDDAYDLVGRCPGPARLELVASLDPTAVAPIVVAWAADVVTAAA